MRRGSFWHSYAQSITATLLLLLGAGFANATDSYNAQTHQLTIPSLRIGVATYTNTVVTIGTVLSGPKGTSANGSQDSYNPTTKQLTVPAVTVGSTTYYNVVASVAGLVSIASVSGADTYNGSQLIIPRVQIANVTYSNVVVGVTPANVISVANGMPNVAQDGYDDLRQGHLGQDDVFRIHDAEAMIEKLLAHRQRCACKNRPVRILAGYVAYSGRC